MKAPSSRGHHCGTAPSAEDSSTYDCLITVRQLGHREAPDQVLVKTCLWAGSNPGLVIRPKARLNQLQNPGCRHIPIQGVFYVRGKFNRAKLHSVKLILGLFYLTVSAVRLCPHDYSRLGGSLTRGMTIEVRRVWWVKAKSFPDRAGPILYRGDEIVDQAPNPRTEQGDVRRH
jgi:hypothetical protein